MELFKSKKFWMSICGVIAVIVCHYMQIPEETSLKIMGVIVAAILGQGIADNGKEKAKIEKGK